MAAIGAHDTPVSTGSWDGPANEARLRGDESAGYYRRAFAWVNPDGDPTTKAAYSFIHHEVSGGGEIGSANATAASTGIAVLNGARTPAGAARPWAGDLQGIWNHLAAHLRDADREPPPLQRRFPELEPAPAMATMGRSFDVPVAIRAQGRRIGGYAAVFDRASAPFPGSIVEYIARDAFSADAIDGYRSVLCRWNHDNNQLLGSVRGKTLSLQIDRSGLEYEVEPPETRRDILELVSRGDITGSSFYAMYEPGSIRWDHGTPGVIKRTLTELRLIDVGPVNRPQYPDTTVVLRELAAERCCPVEEIEAAAAEGTLYRMMTNHGRPIPARRYYGPALMTELQRRRWP